ncbi:MAG: Anther-specific proline-rich protein [Nocardia sp.]|nr:Anther-specific proline-rich protein [Nocardia sp.]
MLHTTEQTRTYPCSSCGGQLGFDPVGQDLLCPNCGNRSAITVPNTPVQARELGPAIAELRQIQAGQAGPQVTGEWEVKCQNCGGTTGFNGTLTATRCPYCATPIQRDDVHNAPARLPVDGLLPFHVGEKQARDLVDKWFSGRWFAPSKFRKYRRIGAFSSLYTAYFTYDADTDTWYRGERGEDYQVRTGTDEDGDPIYETHTRWYPASGEVSNQFADLPVLANENLNRSRIRALEPWPVEEARSYSPEFVAGHLCRTYDNDAEQSLPEAQQRMEQAIESTVHAAIGGDRQIVHESNTSWNWLAYKHLLLPIWLLTVVYMDKPYQVYINGLTGEVAGDRPWSKIKIIALIVAVLVAIVAIILVYNGLHGHHTATGRTTVPRPPNTVPGHHN